MRLVRVATPNGPTWGRLDGEIVHALAGSFAEGFTEIGASWPLEPGSLLAPITPTKIIAVGTNYAAHAAEMGNAVPDEPKIFFKPPSAVSGPGAPIAIPPVTTRVDPEGELAVVIRRRATRVPREHAAAYVFGYTSLNDVTCRDFQKKDGVFARAKGFDGFAPCGPWIDTEFDPADKAIRTVVNGEVRASGRTSDMVFDVATLIAFISSIMTLEPGDVISTGTPPGVSPIQAGDVVRVEIEGLGVLENPVIDRDDR